MIAYLKLFRFPLVFTAIADSAAGYLLVAGTGRETLLGLDTPVFSTLLLLAAASSGLYMFGMGMNDIADRHRDAGIHPDRVLPSGRISLGGARTAVFLVLAGSAVALAFVPGPAGRRFAAWAFTVAAILAYNHWLKIPPVMGLVRGGNFMMGVLSAPVAWSPERLVGGDPQLDPAVLLVALWPVVYGTGLTFVSTLEEGRKSGKMLTAFTAMMIAGAFGPAVVITLTSGLHWGWLAAGALVSWITFRAMRARSRKGVMLLVRDGVAGFILLDASIVLGAGHVGPGIGIAALLVPAFGSVAAFKRIK